MQADYYIRMNGKKVTIVKSRTLLDKYFKDELKIGDYVAYDAENNSITVNEYRGTNGSNNMSPNNVTISSNSNMKWRALGVEDNKVKLVNEDVVYTDVGQSFYLCGAYCYLKGEEILDNACSVFGKVKFAVSARSIKEDNVLKVDRVDKYHSFS